VTSLQLKFASYVGGEGEYIIIGFKMPDGTKQECNFPSDAIVKV